MPVTNDQIYAYLVDLSANIAVQFAEVLTQGDYIQTQNTTISNQVSNVQGYLESEINTGLILNTEQLNAVIIQGDVTQNQITDLSANLTAENQVTDNLIRETYKYLELLIIDETAQVLNSITQQTNDINTNTNTALSQYTNTINTNTNESVSTAVHDINSKIEKTC